MNPRTLMRLVIAIVLVVQLGLGLYHLVSLVGWIPPYGDTAEYMILATAMKVDGYRGILYPAMLAGADRLMGHELLADYQAAAIQTKGLPQEPPPPAVWVQLTQLLWMALVLTYAVRSFFPEGKRLLIGLPLALILFLDPVVLHMEGTLLTDGPCLSFLLLTAAAACRILQGRSPAWWNWVVLLIGGLACSLLRVEKLYVIVLTLVVLSMVCWRYRRRRGVKKSKRKKPRQDKVEGTPGATVRTAILLLGAAVVIGGVSQTINQHFFTPSGRWPRNISWMHERIIRPHLEAIRMDLSPELRHRLSPDQAKEYDTSVQGARRVMNEISQQDPEQLEEFTREMAGVMLRKHPGRLAAELARNATENLFITPAFYARVGTHLVDLRPGFWADRADGNVWTYMVMEKRMGRAATFLLAYSGVLTFLAAIYSIVWYWRRWRSGSPPVHGVILVLLPLGLLWVINAAAFTAAGELVHIRYGLIGHLSILCVIWYPVLRFLIEPFAAARSHPSK